MSYRPTHTCISSWVELSCSIQCRHAIRLCAVGARLPSQLALLSLSCGATPYLSTAGGISFRSAHSRFRYEEHTPHHQMADIELNWVTINSDLAMDDNEIELTDDEIGAAIAAMVDDQREQRRLRQRLYERKYRQNQRVSVRSHMLSTYCAKDAAVHRH